LVSEAMSLLLEVSVDLSMTLLHGILT
jgi:hypothetical protein